MISPGARRSIPALLVAAGLAVALALLALALLRGPGGGDEALGPDFFRGSRRSPVDAEPRLAPPPGSVSATFDGIAAELAGGARAETVAVETAQLFAMALGKRGRSEPAPATHPWSARRSWLRGGLALYELENGTLERELMLFRHARSDAPAASLTLSAGLAGGDVRRAGLRFDLPGQDRPMSSVEAWSSGPMVGGRELLLVPTPTDPGERRRFQAFYLVRLRPAQARNVLTALAAPFAGRP